MNGIWLYRLFDVAEEINLRQVEEILGQKKAASRLRLSRFPCRSIQFRDPPIAVDLGEAAVKIGPRVLHGYFAGKIFDLGVIGLTLRIPLPENDYAAAREISFYLANMASAEEDLRNKDEDNIESLFLAQLQIVRQLLRPALVKPSVQDFVEDFTLYYFTSWKEEWDPVLLLLGENEPVSEQLRNETMRFSLSYGHDDLTVITWEAALVYDARGSTDIPDLIEFALCELLELRYYDQMLDREMERMYDAIEEASRARVRRLGHYRRIMKQLMELMLDITEVTERIKNSLKVTGDVFYARIYGTALTVFRTRSWMESVERKMLLIQQNYSMLNNEIINQRSIMLELAIVVLIMIEILLGFLKILP